MPQLILGLALFFLFHSISIINLPLRDKLAANSEVAWKVFFGIISGIGIVLMIKGYGDLKFSPTILYVSPTWFQHVAALLLLPVFVLFFAPYFPGRISRGAKHPQLVAVKLWSVAHLLVNGTLADVLLFGSFLVWAVADRISMKRRPSRPVPGLPVSNTNDIIVVVLGLAVYGAFVFWLHEVLFGVKPLIPMP